MKRRVLIPVAISLVFQGFLAVVLLMLAVAKDQAPRALASLTPAICEQHSQATERDSLPCLDAMRTANKMLMVANEELINSARGLHGTMAIVLLISISLGAVGLVQLRKLGREKPHALLEDGLNAERTRATST